MCWKVNGRMRIYFKSTIITINDPENYGNRLQNYALSQILGKYGSVTTAFCAGYRPFPAQVARIFHATVSFSKRLLRGIKMKNYALLKIRHSRCVQFTKEYVENTLVSVDVPSGIKPKNFVSDYFVLGSDQVWNCGIHLNSQQAKCFSLFLGSFAPSDSRIISYAASIGLSEINDEKARAMFREYLPRLKAISVREYRGADLIKEIAGLNATVVLDPTLMLSADKWLNITKNIVPENDKYILTYFLGRPSDAQEHDIQIYAETHGCRVRRMLDLRDKETYVAGPQDFVELFSKAQYVFTDSYHACCFSILFHKQFTVFTRAGMTGKSSMNSRMETLFRLFDLDSVIMDSGLAPEIDYEKVDRLLEQHRKESQNWLDKAMEE